MRNMLLFRATLLSQVLDDDVTKSIATKVDQQNAKGETPLMLAAEGGHLDMVQLLLSEDYKANACAIDSGESTALHSAAQGCTADTAEVCCVSLLSAVKFERRSQSNHPGVGA